MAWKDKRGLLNKTAEEENKDENGNNVKSNGKESKTLTNEAWQELLVDDDRGLQRRHFVDTTLLLHFFGPKGDREIRYEDFKK